MLRLKNIKKHYFVGDNVIKALNDVSINFRESEFVAILGQSGSGKTTLLNIIGGLDKYTSGDLIINGVPTDKYNDSDWDTYRNHSVGFVFQSYNLIPHQTILANVELALTLSGVSKAERRRRAAEALGQVGLASQMNKKPNQLSGGQMQRVAIARAIVNEPDILLADEPTGALDSETSIQIMEIIKKISKDRLVIMVTHNPELATQYATRIIKLKDGQITDDSNPCTDAEIPQEELVLSTKTKKEIRNETRRGIKKGKKSMSIFTALSLSLNNLSTKRGRTILTSFAGSIGIIGIALIMALSNGIQLYINRVQEDTLSTYPITIESEVANMSSIISSIQNNRNDDELVHDRDAIYENTMMFDLMNAMLTVETKKNNLKSFKEFLDKELNPLTSTTGLHNLATIRYIYNTPINVFTKDTNGKIVKADYSALLSSMMSSMGMQQTMMGSGFGYSSDIWAELLAGDNGEIVNSLLHEQYELIDGGRWPEKFNEVVLVVNKNNELSDIALYALGLITADELTEEMNSFMKGETVDKKKGSWTYDQIKNQTFKLVVSPNMFLPGDGKYDLLTDTDVGMQALYSNGLDLKIVGIVRQSEDATAGMISGTIGFTSKLTEYIITETSNSELIKQQLANPNLDALTNLPFKNENTKELTNEEKVAYMKEYIANSSVEQRAELCIKIMSIPSDEYVSNMLKEQLSKIDRETIEKTLLEQYPQYGSYLKDMDDETLFGLVAKQMEEEVRKEYAKYIQNSMGKMPAESLSAMLDTTPISDSQYIAMYSEIAPKEYSDSTYEDNLKLLGYVTLDNPTSINIFASTFADKDAISDIIAQYNKSVDESDRISYTDFVKLLMSSITTIIKAISYVLIAFVAISLVVSSIMIGIITYISVLERTKEIGILRSVGASKKDVSRVFNAETLIIGFLSGAIGIGVSLVLCIPINIIIRTLSGISSIGAELPIIGAIALVAISMILTFISGLIPSRVAAKKDPVTALRSE
ncbi:MAG: ABC transporter ATP-binding protein/permease [Clostridia bacterium]|nr:ABC transporter ATP-binding protein/permease [Clostridia bacterium]